MLYYNYNNVRLKVDNQDILADSASFSTSTDRNYTKLIDRRGGFEGVAGGRTRTSLNLSYYLTGEDPFYGFTNTTADTLHSVNAGGMELVSGYLTNYGFSIEPNGVAKASVTLNFYGDITGSFTPESKPDTKRSYLKNEDASVTLQGIDISSKITSLKYSVQSETQTVEKIPISGVIQAPEYNYVAKRTSIILDTYNVFESLPLGGKEAVINLSLGGMVFNVNGILESKEIAMNFGAKLTSTLGINQIGYGRIAKAMTDPNYLMHKGGPFLWQGSNQQSTWGRATIRPGDTVKMWGYNILDWHKTEGYTLGGTRIFIDDVEVNDIVGIITSAERSDAWNYIKFVWPRFTNMSGNSRVRVTTPRGESNFITAVVTGPSDIP